ncbi:MAG TPA: NAD(P)/FAD-dependent oxidoreductase [Gemmatimonadaceae bacterium]|nr:NAD(P)/FAD-dependent oxidoreductase [Gemmatimonadaceae bacterium]
MRDVIVIGARCAGASTAMLLARKGYDVLLVDRAAFPSDIPHGHFIHRHGPRRLARWGLLDRVAATNCPPVTSFTTDFGDFTLTGHDLARDGVAMGYAPRRGAMDKLLVDAAVEAGAELRERFAVSELVTDRDRVAGVRGAGSGGTPVAERARVTVGADGRRSPLARAVGAAAYEEAAPATCWYFSYWSGVEERGLELYVRDGKAILVFPTNDGLLGIFIAWAAEQLSTVRSDIERSFMAVLDEVPPLAERVRAGRREERFAGATDLPNFMRKPFGAGWALVGDAGCHKDPMLALGMCDAFRDAELLADALDEGLSGRRPMEEALADYERRRNEETLPDFRQNLQRARFEPLPPEMRLLRAALRDNPDDTRRFYLAFEGMIPPESFFAPENIRRIVAAAGLAPRGPA